MAVLDLSFSAVSVPTNTSASVTVYEDVDDNGGSNSTTLSDGSTLSYDNSDSVSLSDGVTSYSTGDVFAGGSGNRYWVQTTLSNTDVTVTASETWNTLTLSVPASSVSETAITSTSANALSKNETAIAAESAQTASSANPFVDETIAFLVDVTPTQTTATPVTVLGEAVAIESGFTETEAEPVEIVLPSIPRVGFDVDGTEAETRHGIDFN